MPNAFPMGDEYLMLPRAQTTWLVESLLPVGGLVMLYGEPKVGKSYAALQLAVALTSGQSDWLGFPIHQPSEGRLKVAYLQLDTPRSLWADRIQALKAVGVPVERVYLADRETLDLFPFDILNPEHASRLRESLSAIKPDVVVVDTLREVHSGEENDATTMRNTIAELQAAVQPACLVLIGHSRKTPSGANFDIIADHRGSNYVVGRMDTILYFRKGGFNYVGRAIEGGAVKLDRLDTGLWLPKDELADGLAMEIMTDTTLMGIRAKARKLAERTGRPEEACRSILRRLLSAPPPQALAQPAPPSPDQPSASASPPQSPTPPASA